MYFEDETTKFIFESDILYNSPLLTLYRYSERNGYRTRGTSSIARISATFGPPKTLLQILSLPCIWRASMTREYKTFV